MGAFAAVLLAAIVSAVLYYLHDQEVQTRRREMAALASQLGLEFDHEARTDFPPHRVFQRGHSKRRFNTLEGHLNLGGQHRRVEAGDHWFTEGHGKHARRYLLSYAVIDMRNVGMPSLDIRTENVFDKLKSSVGIDDIDFESEEFSRQFWVTSDDKKFAYDVIHARMMAFLLREPSPRIELQDDQLCLTVHHDRWSPEELQQWLAWGGEFLALWPEHVLERYPGEEEE